MSIKEHAVLYKDAAGKEYEGYVAYLEEWEKKNEKRPGILIHHALMGLKEFEKDVARKLAKLGYVAFAADIYGKGNRANTKEEGFAFLKDVRIGDRVEMSNRLQASLVTLKAQPCVDGTRIGAMGYCLGGTCALDIARRNFPGVKAVVSLHGSLTPPENFSPNDSIKAIVAVHHGALDSHIPDEQVSAFYKEMGERKTDWYFTAHGTAMHGFAMKESGTYGVPGVGYDQKADERSWADLVHFFGENL